MKHGDIVQLGRHRLMCGDSFDPEHLDELMQGEKPDMLYCDPPYGMKFSAFPIFQASSGGAAIGGATAPRRQYAPVIGDDTDFNPEPIISLFKDCKEQFWWGADYYAERIPMRSDGSWVVWDKRLTVEGDTAYGSCFELCWSRARHRRVFARIKWCGFIGVAAEPGGRRVHPNHKPVLLAEWFLERYSKPESLVVDLFAGSGGTLLACERMGRRAYCMEISPEYCQVIIDRYQKMTQQPKLLEAS